MNSALQRCAIPTAFLREEKAGAPHRHGADVRPAVSVSELDRIDGLLVPYKPRGPNSNTVASTLLKNCGVPRQKPVLIAPGWNNPIL
jgi:hypothetical protein